MLPGLTVGHQDASQWITGVVFLCSFTHVFGLTMLSIIHAYKEH